MTYLKRFLSEWFTSLSQELQTLGSSTFLNPNPRLISTVTMSITSSRSHESRPPVDELVSEPKSTQVLPDSLVAAPQFAEGGTKAWLVVLGCWCTSFASFGIVNSFG